MSRAAHPPRPEAGRGARPPLLEAARVVGPGESALARARRMPLGAQVHEGARDVLVTLGPDDGADVASVARALPDPTTLGRGALVVVLPDVASARSLAGRLFAALGRAPGVPRVLRCTALLARGYVDVGGGVDPETGVDLAWGRVALETNEP